MRLTANHLVSTGKQNVQNRLTVNFASVVEASAASAVRGFLLKLGAYHPRISACAEGGQPPD